MYAEGFDICSNLISDGCLAPTALLLPALSGEGSEVQQPEKKVGAVGSIELMVAMAIAVIATFNFLKRAHWHIFSSFFA